MNNVENLAYKNRVAAVVLKKASQQVETSISARVAVRWALGQTTALNGKMDAVLRAMVLEGGFGVTFGQWANKPNPLKTALLDISREHGEKIAQNLTVGGWFAHPGTPGYLNLYTMLAAKAAIMAKGYGMDPDVGQDAMATLFVRIGKRDAENDMTVRSNARSAGVLLANDMKTEIVGVKERGLPLLRTILKRIIQDLAKGQKVDQKRRQGPFTDDEGAEVDVIDRLPDQSDKPTLSEAVRASFHDPNDEIGKYIRGKMRTYFQEAYANKGRQQDGKKPPMIHLMDKLEDPANHEVVNTSQGPQQKIVMPRIRDIADDLSMALSSVKLRHTMPLLRGFMEKFRSDKEIKKTLGRMFFDRGYAKQEIQEFFDRPNPFQITNIYNGSPMVKIVDN